MTMKRPAAFALYWGKCRPIGAVPFHPVWAHGLDVAAAGRAILRARPRAFREAARRLGWTLEELEALWLHLLALHDLGKFSPLFQSKVATHYPDHLPRPDGYALSTKDPGHPKAGLLLMTTWLDATDPPLPLLREWSRGAQRALLQPIFGHHGRPVAIDTELDDLTPLFRPEAAKGDALSFCRTLEELLPVPEVRRPAKASLLAAESWMLAGATVLADWIGSNQEWFRYVDAEMPMPDYWTDACRQAETAVRAAGLVPAGQVRRVAFAALTGIAASPTAAQAWADTVPLPAGPILILIEDVTGSGKSEAALVLAHRLLAAGAADGLYVALPTMATANAMFDRMATIAPRLFAEGAYPSLALAHGRAGLHAAFRAAVPGFDGAAGGAEGGRREIGERSDGEAPDSAVAAPAWLASESRKALLADLGVGTIDQAVLAVLPNRFGTVRLAGLAGKVLIIDEAHAYDSYVGAELERLIAFHAAGGGTTIVLSATLPGKTKGGIVEAWRKAVGVPTEMLAAAAPSQAAYPLATLVDATGVRLEAPLGARADLCRTLTITRVPDVEAAITRVRQAVAAGASVAWIRNSVDDAIEAAEMLRDLAPELFHARFAMGDRLAIEKRVLSRFGKASTAADRAGRVVVATQVIEQSLDLDFDLVVSDLAPIDSLLQRAGRLWRHTHRLRPVAGPELVVLSPDPARTVAADWMRSVLPRAARVYRDHAVLWRTARELFASPVFRVPEDVRAAIDAVYDAAHDGDIPVGLERIRNEALGRSGAERSIADQNLLVFAEGYGSDGRGWPDEGRVATRLAEESRVIRLARAGGGGLVPWIADPDPRIAWALSEVRAYEHRLRGRHAPEPRWHAAAGAARSSWGRFDDDISLLPLEEGSDGVWQGVLVDEAGRRLEVRYSTVAGLVL